MIDSRLETCVKHCHIHTVASPIAWAVLTVQITVCCEWHLSITFYPLEYSCLVYPHSYMHRGTRGQAYLYSRRTFMMSDHMAGLVATCYDAAFSLGLPLSRHPVHFLPTYWLCYCHLNQRTAYFSLSGLTTHANELQDRGSYLIKVHQICSCSILFIDSVNATFRIAIRPPVKVTSVKHNSAAGIALPC